MLKHGPPPPDRRVGCTGPGAPGCPGRACGHKGDSEGVSFACKATKERRVSAMVFGGREVESKGLSKPWCKRSFARNSAEWKVELREPAI